MHVSGPLNKLVPLKRTNQNVPSASYPGAPRIFLARERKTSREGLRSKGKHHLTLVDFRMNPCIAERSRIEKETPGYQADKKGKR